ncbi:MAG: PDZ domain-containing protein, partial [Syntrophales bacterium]|nr:PDZ domain-containing protein [Syntrophales bacterium]
AKAILDDLKTKGRVTRGWLGVAIQEVTPEMAKSLKLKDTKGALVGQVFEGDPADKAGIKAGDVIIAIDGRSVADSHELLRTVANLTVGKKITVTLIRDGEEMTVELTVGQRRDAVDLARGDRTSDDLGISVQEVTPELARRLGLARKEGVVVTEVKRGSPADEAGIKVQDVILRINKVKINTVADLVEELKKTPKDMPVLLLIRRDEGTMFVTIRRDGDG